MIRDINILNTGISPKFEHVFSSKKHKIFRAYQRQTAQTYLTKIIIAKDERVFRLYKQHIAHVILPYLISIKYLSQSSLLSLEQECGQALVKTQYEKENEQSYDYEGNEQEDNKQTFVRKEKDSQSIFISKKMLKGVTLRQMILNKDERLNEQFCLDLIAQIVDFLLIGKAVRDMFITTQNIIVEDTGVIHFNYFSFVGLEFIKQDKYITKVQFEQILPYLTPTLIKSKSSIDIQVELRFILINYVSAFFKKDIIFGAGHFDLEVQVKRDKQLLAVVSKVTDTLLPDILSPAQKKRLENQRGGMINLWNELFKQKKKSQRQVQIQNKQSQVKRTFNCTWQQILQNLSTYYEKQEVSEFGKSEQNNNQQMKDKSKQQRDRRCKIKIKSFISNLNIIQIKNCRLIASSLHNFVDIFIDILDHVVQTESSRLQLKNIAKIQKLRDDLLFQRSDLIKRARYSKSLYIPIKTGMKFASILKYKNWVMMLQVSDCANQATIQAAFILLKFILDTRQTMVEIGSQISSSLLKSILQSKKAKNIEEKSQLYDLLYSLSEHQNFRRYSWQIFFVVTNKIVLLVKEFYLRTTSYNFAQKIKINQQDFSSILQTFKEFIPPLPSESQKTEIIQDSSPKKSIQQISDAEDN